jgi:2-oxoglutarate ferredoxin oxidoreductase subunit beta
MDENYKPDDKVKAFEKTQEREPWPLGIFYNVEGKKSFEENLPVYEGNRTPLYKRDRDMSVVREILESKR